MNLKQGVVIFMLKKEVAFVVTDKTNQKTEKNFVLIRI